MILLEVEVTARIQTKSVGTADARLNRAGTVRVKEKEKQTT